MDRFFFNIISGRGENPWTTGINSKSRIHLLASKFTQGTALIQPDPADGFQCSHHWTVFLLGFLPLPGQSQTSVAAGLEPGVERQFRFEVKVTFKLLGYVFYKQGPPGLHWGDDAKVPCFRK